MKADLLAAPGKSHAPSPVGPSQAVLVYVTNRADGTITVIDSATNTIRSALRPSNLDQYPHLDCMAVTADGRVCVAQHQDSYAWRQGGKQDHLGALVVFDSSTLKQVRVISVCEENPLNSLAISPDMKAFATSDEGVYAIDIDKGRVLHHIELKEKLGGIAILPSGKAFIVCRNKSHVFVIDTQTYATMSVVNVGNRPGDVAVSRDNQVWIAHLGEAKIVAIDGDTNMVTTVINRPLSFSDFLRSRFFQSLAVAPNGKVYATERNGSRVFVVDPTTKSIVAEIQVGVWPVSIAASDHGVIYVANSGGNTVSVIDSATDAVVATIGVGRRPHRVAVS